MNAAISFPEVLTLQTLARHMHRSEPKLPGDAQSWFALRSALGCGLISALAALTAAAVRDWLPVLGWVVVIGSLLGWLLILWACSTPLAQMIRRGVGAVESQAEMADRRWNVVLELARHIALAHDRSAIEEALKAVRSGVAGAERRKYVAAGLTAVAAAVAALVKEPVPGGYLEDTVMMIRALAPALSLISGLALLSTLGFLDVLHRIQEALDEALFSKGEPKALDPA